MNRIKGDEREGAIPLLLSKNGGIKGYFLQHYVYINVKKKAKK